MYVFFPLSTLTFTLVVDMLPINKHFSDIAFLMISNWYLNFVLAFRLFWGLKLLQILMLLLIELDLSISIITLWESVPSRFSILLYDIEVCIPSLVWNETRQDGTGGHFPNQRHHDGTSFFWSCCSGKSRKNGKETGQDGTTQYHSGKSRAVLNIYFVTNSAQLQ